MTEKILKAKKETKATWSAIAKACGLSEVYVTSACLGENALSLDEAKKVTECLCLPSDISVALTEFATKGEASPTIPKEPHP